MRRNSLFLSVLFVRLRVQEFRVEGAPLRPKIPTRSSLPGVGSAIVSILDLAPGLSQLFRFSSWGSRVLSCVQPRSIGLEKRISETTVLSTAKDGQCLQPAAIFPVVLLAFDTHQQGTREKFPQMPVHFLQDRHQTVTCVAISLHEILFIYGASASHSMRIADKLAPANVKTLPMTFRHKQAAKSRQ